MDRRKASDEVHCCFRIKLLWQNKPRIGINKIRARVTRACIHGDMVNTCIDHGHCLHHDANTTRDFIKLWRFITKNINPWSRLLSNSNFWNLPPRKNPAKFRQNYDLQVRSNSNSSTSLFYNVHISIWWRKILHIFEDLLQFLLIYMTRNSRLEMILVNFYIEYQHDFQWLCNNVRIVSKI